ncbi:MAG TPA: glycosyltransferase family 4 protein [Patescibacteria group bacterium]|nr:glycosyltransferase family 4 protein [Patescibacteria group bacterium]
MIQKEARKKILLVTRPIAPPWDEASKNFAYYLAKTLSTHDFYVLTNGYLPDLPPHIHQKAIYTSNKLSYLQRIRLLKLRNILRENFDVIHYMLTPSKLNSLGFKTFIKSGKARTIQTVATLREDLLSDKDYKDILFADLIITYSDYARNKLNSIGFKNVKRVYPGIDLELYKPTAKNEKMQKMFSVSNDDFVIQYAGGEYARLGAMDDIVDLIEKYSNEFKKRRVVFFFPGRMKDKKDFVKKAEIKEKIKKIGAEEIVRYSDEIEIDPQSHDQNWMSRLNNISDIVLFPVKNMKGKFDIPLFVPEAMACGKPVVISDLPILSELSNGKNSVIIPRGDIDALYQTIIDLYDNPDKRYQIGQEARKFVEENFDIKNIAEIYQLIYDKI